MKADATTIGAGPAGLFAAYEVVERNMGVIVVEKGKWIENRKEIMIRIGGAVLYSDGKRNLRSLHGEKNLFEFFARRGILSKQKP